MRLLVDTHVLLWAIAEPDKLSARWRAMLESSENEILFSAASIWELAIKLRIGRLSLPVGLNDLIQTAKLMELMELPISAAHAAGVRQLPLYHRDPFDRVLVAQAIHEPARLLTADFVLRQYSDLVEIMG
ncbi:MAG: type II toxin-antitoxin system VapC family toxin [Candidatus Binataceae bacterium]